MKARFSFEDAKSSLNGDAGYLFDLSSPYEDAARVGGLGSSARSFLNSAIKCFLVGYNDPAHLLLEKAEHWLVAAIEMKERPRRYFQNGTEAGRLYDLALCRWLAHNNHDVELLTESINFWERYYDHIGKLDQTSFILTLPEYVDAGRFSDAATRAAGLGSIKKTLEMKAASAITARQIDDTTRKTSVNDLLDSKMSEWLARGHFDLAAKWLKVCEWLPTNSRSAIDIITEARKRV